MIITRKMTISDKEVYVFDDAFDIASASILETQLSYSYYSLHSSSSIDTTEYKEAMCEFDTEDFKRHFLFDVFMECFGFMGLPADELECREVLANCIRYGGYSFSHEDIAEPNYYSALVFGNSVWDPTWGGETLLCLDDGEPVQCLQVKACRVAIFPCNLIHIAGLPNRLSADFRYSLSARFKRLDRQSK